MHDEAIRAFLLHDHGRVVRTVAAACGDRERAEDAVQDALVDVWTKDRPVDDLPGWVDDDDVCDGLERLTDPAGGTPTADVLWSDLVARRCRRRARERARAAVPLVLVAVLGGGVLAAQDPDTGRSGVAAGGRGSETSDEAPTGGFRSS